MADWSDLVYAGIGILGGGFGVKIVEYLRDGLRLRESESGRLWAEIGRLHSKIGDLESQLRTVSADRERLLQENIALRHEVDDLRVELTRPPKYTV